MALIGNLRNFSSVIQSLSISGLYKGAVKLISQFKTDTVALTKTLSTVFYFGFFTGIAMLLAMISVLTLLPSLILISKPFGK